MIPLQQIHPIAIHFPIVFFLSMATLDLYARLRAIPIDGRGAIANLSAGLATLAGISAIIAYIFGDIALDIAKAGGVLESRTELHETLGTTTAIMLAIWAVVRALIWYRNTAVTQTKFSAIVAVELLLALLIITTAYFGGQLVYEYGVNVALPHSG